MRRDDEHHVSRAGSETSSPTRARVLLVDDQPANLLALEALLAPLGQEIVCASSGEAALAEVASRDFAVIVLDVNMPRLDGFATARLMKQFERSARVPILFLTGLADDAAALFRAYAQGGVDYLIKPIDPEMMRAKVRVFVDLHLKTLEIAHQAELLRQRERELSEKRYAELLESSARRPAQLLAISTALAGALTPADVARTLLDHAIVALEVQAGCVLHRSGQRTTFEVVDARGFDAPELDALGRADTLAPAVEQGLVLVERASLNVGGQAPPHPPSENSATSLRSASLAGAAAVTSAEERGAVVAIVPLSLDGNMVGAVALAFGRGRAPSDADRAICQVLGRQCAQALERSYLYEAEETARLQAEQATRSRDDMLAIVSHDLRNPLATILMSTEQLDRTAERTSLDAERARRLVQRIHRCAARMNHLIQDLLDLASLDSGRFSITKDSVSAEALVHEAAGLMAPLARARGIDLTPEVQPGLSAVQCDHQRLLQVFENLVGNALKFTPDGGRIGISARADAEQLILSVSDTGTGISADHVPHVFDRYWQSKRSGSGGVGLGLAIARALVEAHGGKIWVESEVGVGSTFWFTIPCDSSARSGQRARVTGQATPAPREVRYRDFK
jgi:signal transduction histidine kinase/DNA-binding response OmpR family regulator